MTLLFSFIHMGLLMHHIKLLSCQFRHWTLQCPKKYKYMRISFNVVFALLVMYREALCPAVHGVAKSQTQLSNLTELNWSKNKLWQGIMIRIVKFGPCKNEKLWYSSCLWIKKKIKQSILWFYLCYSHKSQALSYMLICTDSLKPWLSKQSIQAHNSSFAFWGNSDMP